MSCRIQTKSNDYVWETAACVVARAARDGLVGHVAVAITTRDYRASEQLWQIFKKKIYSLLNEVELSVLFWEHRERTCVISLSVCPLCLTPRSIPHLVWHHRVWHHRRWSAFSAAQQPPTTHALKATEHAHSINSGLHDELVANTHGQYSNWRLSLSSRRSTALW